MQTIATVHEYEPGLAEARDAAGGFLCYLERADIMAFSAGKVPDLEASRAAGEAVQYRITRRALSRARTLLGVTP